MALERAKAVYFAVMLWQCFVSYLLVEIEKNGERVER